MPSYPYLELEGDGRARGTAYGRAARGDIQANIASYKERLSRSGRAWPAARAISRRFLPAIESFDRDLQGELEAIASSAGVDLEDLLILNARTSFLYNLSDDCTSIALLSTEHGRCEVLGQNWDNMARLRPVRLRVKQPGRPTLLTLTEAGTLAKIGLNDGGIGVCVNGLRRPGDVLDPAVPLFVFLRRLLESTSLREAVDLVLSTRRDAPHNFLIASRDEGAADVETLYAEAEVLRTQGEALVHTNHVLSNRLRKIDRREPSRNSVLRLQRTIEALRSAPAERSAAERILAVLGDHANEPDSICRHRTATEGGFETVTKHAVIMTLTPGEMLISDGPPCAAPIDSFRIAGMLAPVVGEDRAVRSESGAGS